MKTIERGHGLASANRTRQIQTYPPVIKPTRTIPFLGIHGLWGIGNQWGLCSSSAERSMLPCILKGHERYDDHNLDRVSIMDYVGQIIFCLEQVGPSILIGHSAGGYEAQLVANLRPDLVKGLVLMASAMPRGDRIHGLAMQSRFAWPRYIWAMATGWEYHLRPAQYRFVQGRTKVMLGRESGLATREVLFRKFPVQPITHCPVLSITGSNDQFADVGRQRLLAEFHHAEFKVVFGDHMFHCDPQVAPNVFVFIRDWCHKHQI